MGRRDIDKKTEDNDKLRLFGLLFHEDNSDKLHCLSIRITSCNQSEDPDLILKGLFQLLALDFNNGDFYVQLLNQLILTKITSTT